ncbi:MAG: TMEM175 family protein [Myxococcales bacterium]
MRTGRLEAFSDGVLAILITIMVLELKVPHGADLEALHHITPVLCAYILSFIYIGIYWNNHHHMLHTCDQVSGGILWANLHLLFWLSLVPFGTDWMGENHLAPLPTALYGVVLFAAGVAYLILQKAIIRRQGERSRLRALIGNDLKGKTSAVLYLLGIGFAFVHTTISQVIYVSVAGLWLIPDRRIEAKLAEE